MKYFVLVALLSLSSLMAKETIKTIDSKIIEITEKDVRVGVLCIGGYKFAYASRAYESSSLTQIMAKSDAIGLEPIPCK